MGIAFGSLAGGVAVGSLSVSAAALTGLIIAVIAIPVAWAISFLKAPVVEQATDDSADAMTATAR